MELYLGWLKRHACEADEADPLGMILCAGKSEEHIALLELQKSGIHVASYLDGCAAKERTGTQTPRGGSASPGADRDGKGLSVLEPEKTTERRFRAQRGLPGARAQICWAKILSAIAEEAQAWVFGVRMVSKKACKSKSQERVGGGPFSFEALRKVCDNCRL